MQSSRTVVLGWLNSVKNISAHSVDSDWRRLKSTKLIFLKNKIISNFQVWFYFKTNMEVNSGDDTNASKSKSNEDKMKIWPQVRLKC